MPILQIIFLWQDHSIDKCWIADFVMKWHSYEVIQNVYCWIITSTVHCTIVSWCISFKNVLLSLFETVMCNRMMSWYNSIMQFHMLFFSLYYDTVISLYMYIMIYLFSIMVKSNMCYDIYFSEYDCSLVMLWHAAYDTIVPLCMFRNVYRIFPIGYNIDIKITWWT